jgi:hypothetical protein
MQHLANALHTAASTPPPTSIDLDRLVADEQRGARRRRAWAAVGAGLTVAALAGVIAVAPGAARDTTGHGQGAVSDPVVKPVPTTPALTLEQQAEAGRLASVFSGAVQQVIGPTTTQWSANGFTWEALTGWAGHGVPAPGYVGTGTLTAPDGDITKVAVLVQRVPAPTDTTCANESQPEIECTVQSEADGTQVWRFEARVGGQDVRRAEVYRPDGVHVLVEETAVGGYEHHLSLEQLIGLAHTPGLTLP